MTPTLSIVTVCRNAADQIGATIQSVLTQRWTDYEYIFIDGASRDGTVARIRNCRQDFGDRGVSVHVTSEPDRGIYDAMNKGIDRASGQWVLMLNAGDCLADPMVLEDLFGDRAYDGDVLYGDAFLWDRHRGKDLFRPFGARPLEKMAMGLPFCHQSVFARRELLERYRFVTDFSIAGDYDLFLRAYMDGAAFQHVPRVVALFDCGGICLRRPHVTVAQCAAVRKYRSFPQQRRVGILTGCLRGAARGAVRRFLPGLFYAPARGWREELPRDGSGRVVLDHA